MIVGDPRIYMVMFKVEMSGHKFARTTLSVPEEYLNIGQEAAKTSS